MQKINVKIVNADGIVAVHNADLVVVPGLQGDIGINASDRVVPYLLKAGVVYIFNNNYVEYKYGLIDGRFYYEANSVDATKEPTLIVISNFKIYKIDNKDTSSLKKDIEVCENLVQSSSVVELKNYYTEKLNKFNNLLTALNNVAY